jgi:hypothetical protein
MTVDLVHLVSASGRPAQTAPATRCLPFTIHLSRLGLYLLQHRVGPNPRAIRAVVTGCERPDMRKSCTRCYGFPAPPDAPYTAPVVKLDALSANRT